MVRRHALLVLTALLLGAGCRAAGTSALPPTSDPVAVRPVPTAETVISRLNSNARLVQSLKAEPSITVVVTSGKRKEQHPLNGLLGMERPRNFRLELLAPTLTQSKEADIGSNEEGFWFWVKRSKEKEVYVCRYSDTGDSPLAAAFQPDWIVEALGLREIPAEEAADYAIRRGEPPATNTLVLTRRLRTPAGESYMKMLIVDAATGVLREHRLYAGDQKTMLARAVVPPGHYQRVAVSARPEEGVGATAVVLPTKIQLSWVKEQLDLIVDVGKPEINPALPAGLFTEPTTSFKGYTRVDISGPAGTAGRATTTIRETRPAPPAGVQLHEPEPLGVEGASRSATDTAPLASSVPAGRERIVRPGLPTAEAGMTSGWSRASGLVTDR